MEEMWTLFTVQAQQWRLHLSSQTFESEKCKGILDHCLAYIYNGVIRLYPPCFIVKRRTKKKKKLILQITSHNAKEGAIEIGKTLLNHFYNFNHPNLTTPKSSRHSETKVTVSSNIQS